MSNFEPTEEQQAIIFPGKFSSAMIIAKAGSGKTNTLVRRAVNQAKQIKPWKNIAIISFTKTSSEDIRLKLKQLYGKQVMVLTFHAFLINHVLAFDSHFRNKEILFDFYDKSTSLNEWLNKIKTNHVITVSKEPKGDYIFQYALETLNTNSYIPKYLQSRFEAIYIDEAQDNNQLQYQIIKVLLDIGVQVVLVGDPNQTIYGFRGANSQAFRNMQSISHFENNIYELTRNFRCHELISQCAENYTIPTQSLISKEDDTSYGVWIITIDNLSRIIETFNEEKFLHKGLCFLFWSLGKPYSVQIIEDYNLIVIDLPKFIREQSKDAIYEENLNLLFRLFFSDISFEFVYIERFLSNLKSQTARELIRGFKNNLSLDTLKALNYHIEFIKEEHFEEIVNSLNLPETKQFYRLDKTKNYAMTIHASKGLEFKNVVLNTKDFSEMHKENTRNMFYVACTRAEKRLFFVR